MRFDVTTFGELVIDLVPFASPAGAAYLAKPGGAPANVAAGVARLGHRAAMITRVGTEAFGRAARAALEAAGVALDAVIRDAAHATALAVVSRTADGGADFSFYRENCADSNLEPADVPAALIAASRLLHVGTLPLATPLSAAAQRHAVATAKAAGTLVSTDVNFRAAFWPDQEAMRAAGLEAIGAANIAKVSGAELERLAGADSPEAVRALWHPDLILLAVTRGAAGADLFTKDARIALPGFAVDTLDAVGCGDAFMASLLASLIEADFVLAGDALEKAALRASAAGAIMATRSGALESMPTGTEIDAFLRSASPRAPSGDPEPARR